MDRRSPAALVRPEEVEFSAIRAQGAGGQHVNKVASAVHLRFDIRASSLPEAIRTRLLALRDQHITGEGMVVIKSQGHRSQEQNKAEALARLQALVDRVAAPPPPRRPTRPTRGSERRRRQAKTARSEVKRQRGRVGNE